MDTNLALCVFVYVALIGSFITDANTVPGGIQKLKEKLKELDGKETNDDQQNRRIVFQGDILLTKSAKEARKIINSVSKEKKYLSKESREPSRLKRHAVRRNETHENLWVDGVKYVLDPKSSREMRNGFTLAAKAWEENSCINFKQIAQTDITGEGTDYLYVTDKDDGDGCLSHVGKLGGYQPLILGPGCETFAHTAHEVGHALGLYHTQNRHDRDEHLEVQWKNIKGYEDQYVKLTEEQSNNYGLPYDFGSIMHYGSTIREPTMIPSDVNYKTTMGSPMISFMDLSMINKLYGCEANCEKESSAKCKNGGFPHPRKCDECICPGGYGGPLCDQLPKDCEQGTELMATKGWNTLQAYVYNRKGDGSYATCTYWIKSPNGKVEVQIESIVNSQPTVGCAKAGVEIKANANHTLTGYRYCVEQESTLTSTSSVVPVILYTNDFTWTIVQLKYRYVD